jgi:hypothetical protein
MRYFLCFIVAVCNLSRGVASKILRNDHSVVDRTESRVVLGKVVAVGTVPRRHWESTEIKLPKMQMSAESKVGTNAADAVEKRGEAWVARGRGVAFGSGPRRHYAVRGGVVAASTGPRRCCENVGIMVPKMEFSVQSKFETDAAKAAVNEGEAWVAAGRGVAYGSGPHRHYATGGGFVAAGTGPRCYCKNTESIRTNTHHEE